MKWGQAVKDGDKYALAVRNFLAGHLGRIATMAINCYDPEIVMLAGYVAEQCTDHLAAAIYERIETDVFDNHARKIKIIPARAGTMALILGIASAILHDNNPKP
jgi:predicted NBD/HSP70 family sugar kinase